MIVQDTGLVSYNYFSFLLLSQIEKKTSMQVILGVIFHFIGGFASGSFYIPYKKVSSMWGIILKEWKGVSKKAFNTILIDILTIIISVILVG